MLKIITITANTAIDLRIQVDALHSEDTLLATSTHEFAAGKGINVAKTLASLNCPVSCLGFVGQQSSSLFQQLDSAYILTDFIGVEGKTRRNLTLHEQTTNNEIHIRTHGFSVDAHACQQLAQQLAQLLKPGDTVVLSGSLPPGCPVDFFAQLIKVAHAHAARCFLDSSGASLAAAITAKPDCIKPNQHELAALSGVHLHDERDIIAAARTLLAQGIPQIVVSCGARGIIALTPTQLWRLQAPAPAAIVSTVGCGDALVGGLAYATLHNLALADTLKLAMSCANANLLSHEPGCFDKTLLQTIQNSISLHTEPSN